MSEMGPLVLRRERGNTFEVPGCPPNWLGTVAEIDDGRVFFGTDREGDPLVDFLESAKDSLEGYAEPVRSEPITFCRGDFELVVEAVACRMAEHSILVLTPWSEHRKRRLRNAREDALRADTLERLSQDWQEQKRSLQEGNAALERFARAASHDLRQPLRTMRGFADILTSEHSESLDEEASKFLGFIAGGAESLSRLIERLLEFARLRDAVPVRLETNLETLASHTWARLGDLAEDRGAEMIARDLPIVIGDAVLLEVVLQNLLENAIKYSDPETTPRIEITAEDAQDATIISVADNGLGIPEAELENLFVAFARYDPDGTREGNGLGLALCREAVERWGGVLSAHPNGLGGTTFRFTIPKAEIED